MGRIFVMIPNEICEKCDKVLFGGIMAGGRILLACRKENCEWSDGEAQTAYETIDGDRVVARKIKRSES